MEIGKFVCAGSEAYLLTTKKTDKKTSPKKIEANRRNSNKSTGPNTKRGKVHSSMNATKGSIQNNLYISLDSVMLCA